jgi:tetratricopeptide (TPR) repeat protein
MKLALMNALFTLFSTTAIAQSGAYDARPGACIELSEAVMTQATKGHLAEAEALLPAAWVSGDDPGHAACIGTVLGNLARTAAMLGHVADAERLAEHSLRILEKAYPRNDRMLMRPLQLLAVLRMESGRTARAREAVRRIQLMRIKYPEDRAIIHATVGALLQIEGRLSEAETEYQEALGSWEEAGRSESEDAAATLHCLGSLYLKEQRLKDARRVLARAQVIHDRATDSIPADRIKFLNLRSVLHARLGEWRQSEQDLRDALSVADLQPYVDPALLRQLLGNYAHVLRQNHRRREARIIEARKAALPGNGTAAAVVDYTKLLMEGKSAKGGNR